MVDLVNIWIQGDFVIKAVAIILLFMSISTWSVIVFAAIKIIKFKKQKRDAYAFWFAKSLENFKFSDELSPWKELVNRGIYAAKGYDSCGINSPNDKAEWILKELYVVIDKFATDHSYGLNLLSSIGATSPFIGLLGTVWGIYHTLLILGIGSTGVDQIAAPIGEALVMTAFGLAVAIPAVLANNTLIGYNRKNLDALEFFSKELQIFLVTGQRPQKNVK